MQSMNVSLQNTHVSAPSHASIIPFTVPKLLFSLLWSPTICNPIATISAALCFLDIVLFCWRCRYPVTRYRRSCHPFAYHNIFVNFNPHFAETKWFHYLPILSKEGFEIVSFASLLIAGPRAWALVAAFPTGLEKDLEAPFTNSNRLEDKLWKIFWFVRRGCGFALWIGVLCFLILYNLITVQIGWLLAIIFGGGGN